MKNYIELETRVPFRKSYVYFDYSDFYADSIFDKNDIKVKLKDRYHYINENHPGAVIIFCSFWKKDEDKFLQSMEELKNKIMILNKTDYEDIYASIIDNFNRYYPN